MAWDEITKLAAAMSVSRAEHSSLAAQVVLYNNPEQVLLPTADFRAVLRQQLQDPTQSLAENMQSHRQWISRDSLSLDQLTAEALQSSGRFSLLAETTRRQLGLLAVIADQKGQS
jgi:hypothetical protein